MPYPRSSHATVLVIDGDARLQRDLEATLALHGYQVVAARTLAAGVDLIKRVEPDLLLLDLELPDGDGLRLLEQLPQKRPSVIVISTRDQESDKIVALDGGADDYVTKPFGASELLARMRAALRRGRSAPLTEVMVVGPIRIDLPRHEVTADGREIHLTPLEFRILVELARVPGHVITHRQLLIAVWGAAAADDVHTLRVHVGALRKKLEPDAARPSWLLTEMGVGYRLRDR